MSACVEAAPPIASSLPSTDSRAARLARFEREQLIVDYPNRGVSVARIAARVGVGEKRMRAVICDPRTGIRGLARRTPHPPEEFVAIQVGRLNEALLVAYSAMTGANLKAVDRVVKIVRELDRYHGFVTAERRLPEAPAGGTMAFGAALVCRPEFATQGPEDIGFEWTAPLPLSPPLKRGEGWGEGLGRLAAAAYRPAPHLDLLPRTERSDVSRWATCARKIRRKTLKRLNPRPAFRCPSKPWAARIRRDPGPAWQALTRSDKTRRRLTIARRFFRKPLKRLIPRPGTAFAAPRTILRDATRGGASQHEGRACPDVDPAGDRRPEIPLQPIENVESAPGFGWLALAASRPGGARGVRLPTPNPSGAGPPKVRAILDGVMAS